MKHVKMFPVTSDPEEGGARADSAAKVEDVRAQGVRQRASTLSADEAGTRENRLRIARSGVGLKETKTMPCISNRRRFHLSDEMETSLRKLNVELRNRMRRGSLTVVFPVLTFNDFITCWDEHTDLHAHGVISERQVASEELEWWFSDKKDLLGSPVPHVSSQKGSKGHIDTTPNQDNFSLTYFKNGFTLACTFDGHGPFGHFVSIRTVQTVPYFLAKSSKFPSDIPGALVDAFDAAQKEVVVLAMTEGWDIQASGSTAVCALWKGNQVWTANAGDSRCVIGTETARQVVFATEDHKPDDEAERARIEAAGGEVRMQRYADGYVNHRIFVRGEDYPGLCMARSFGDQSVKEHGVVATPEVALTEVDLSQKPFLILATDGVWEFLDSGFVVKAVAKKLLVDGPARTLRKLQKEARKRWRHEEGEYCDDITSIFIQLR